jgi:uncharacterized protein (DUF952 family)
LSEPSGVIVNIARRDDWDAAAQSGRYESESLASEGFIHCSEPRQVVDTANALFRGQPGLVLLCIDPTRLDSPLRYEPSKRGTFPHIYGPLNVSAVTAVLDFAPRPDGSFALPSDLAGSDGD